MYVDIPPLTVAVCDEEIDLGKELDPDGEVVESCGSVAEFSPHVEPLGEGDGDLHGLLGDQGLLPRVNDVVGGTGH